MTIVEGQVVVFVVFENGDFRSFVPSNSEVILTKDYVDQFLKKDKEK